MTRLPQLGPRGEGWVLIQLVLLPAVALAGLMAGPAWHGPAASVGILVGLGLMAGGTYLVGRGLLDLGRNLTPVPHPRADAFLVESGVYAAVRHPIYGGLMTLAFGWALVSASFVAFLLAIVLAGFFGLKSSREEAWLRERYPAHAAYAARTRRFVPRLL
jgi:protein-S-isoprenylcysteine O-methyltransferase Ste14